MTPEEIAYHFRNAPNDELAQLHLDLAATRAECERLREAAEEIESRRVVYAGLAKTEPARGAVLCEGIEIGLAIALEHLAKAAADAADFARRLAAAGQDLASIERLLAGSLADRLMAWPGGPAACIEASIGG